MIYGLSQRTSFALPKLDTNTRINSAANVENKFFPAFDKVEISKEAR